MARTPLLRSLMGLLRAQQIADARGIPLGALQEQRWRAAERRAEEGPHRASGLTSSRRAFMLGAASIGASSMIGCGPHVEPCTARGKQPKIVVVGAGIAGLSAALQLADNGVPCKVYEASGRTGGRMFSNSNYFDQGQVFEWYGELIDTPHVAIRGLAERFKIEVDDLWAAQPPGSRETYQFFGKHYPREDAEKGIAALAPLLKKDLDDCGEDILYNMKTPEGAALDNMSVYDWIEARVPGGHKTPLGALLDTAYYIELNVDTREQSALNLVYLLAYQHDWNNFDMYGDSDERLKTKGGNQRITDAMEKHLRAQQPDIFELGKRMEAIAKRSCGDYELTFRHQNKSETVIADAVILTLPFAVLRDLDYTKAGFDALKHKTIQELGRGRQSKQHLQFTSRVWNQNGPRPYPGTGTSYSDEGYQVTWECTRAQPGPLGILVAYCGGALADAMATPMAVATAKSEEVVKDAKRFLAQGERVFPGLTAAWNGKATQGIPHLDPNFKCSYSHWRVGQYQTIRGYERVPQGNSFFAGEHTSIDFQGFMEGGAQEGKHAANEAMASLGIAAKTPPAKP